MATLTARKRSAFPQRYARKDARTMIYRVVYGIVNSVKGKRSNVPAIDETRMVSHFWTHREALRVWEDYKDQACFTTAEAAEIERRLDILQRSKPSHVLD